MATKFLNLSLFIKLKSNPKFFLLNKRKRQLLTKIIKNKNETIFGLPLLLFFLAWFIIYKVHTINPPVFYIIIFLKLFANVNLFF